MTHYIAYGAIAISFLLGIYWRNSQMVYLAMMGIVLGGALIAFAGCASQPPPQPVPVAVATPAPKPPIPDDPYVGLPADVADAIRNNQSPTFHHGITWIWPYSPDLQYPLYCQPLHVTEIRLQPDETTDRHNVQLGDSTRWGILIGAHDVKLFPRGTNVAITVPGSQQTIPADPNMTTNMVITTNRGHQYVFNPVKIGKPLTQAVSFYYGDEVRTQYAARQTALKQEAQVQ
jgi:Conjugal transfer protein